MATTYDDAIPKHHEATQSEKLVITASSLGTVFEWYDFYLYGLLATIISAQFFSGVNETTGFIFALAAFAAGFVGIGRHPRINHDPAFVAALPQHLERFTHINVAIARGQVLRGAVEQRPVGVGEVDVADALDAEALEQFGYAALGA